MKIEQAISGFLLFKRVEGLSPRTLTLYERQLNHLHDYLGDVEIETITSTDLRRFLDYLRREYVPTRLDGDTSPLSARSIRNYWVALRSMWTWATAELGIEHIVESINTPKVSDTIIEPLTQNEIARLLKCTPTTADGRRNPYHRRNVALILVLLDTGIRVSELCNLKRRDLDLETGRIAVINGKGNKSRMVYIGDRARRGLWRYLAENELAEDASPIFPNTDGFPLSRSRVRKIVANLGKRADVKNVYPHRFRHTFAIQYLRNGGDIFTLQRLLGHSTLEMVRRYLALADVDAERAHRRASPVDNWRV